MCDDLGRQTVTLNWWATSPPEQVDGCMVSDVFEFAFGNKSHTKPLELVCFPTSVADILRGIDKDLDAVTDKY